MRKTLLSSLIFINLTLQPLLNVSHAQTSPLPEIGGPKTTPQQEAEIGKEIYQDLLRYNVITEDIAVNNYLAQLGHTLAQGTTNHTIQFHLFGVNDNAINAFAMPGGYIGVNRGLIVLTQSESELASVLSHEMAHVTQRHLARMQDNKLADSLLMAAGIIAAAAAAAAGNADVASGAIYAATSLPYAKKLAYTRDFEREADRMGMQYLAQAGFDPHAMPEFFTRMHNANKFSNHSEYPFLLTHPLTTTRIAESQTAANRHPIKMKASSIDYLLIREHLRVDIITPEAALKYYPESLQAKQYLNEGAQHYGYARALYLQRQYPQAKQQVTLAKNQLGEHPLFIDLMAKIARQEKQYQYARTLYQQGLTQFYQNKLLIYGQLETLMEMGQTGEARKLIQAQINRDKKNPDFYKLLARTYGEPQPLYAYAARGDAFYYQGLYQAALEQYELALKSENSQKQEDFYIRSQIEAKMLEIKNKVNFQSKKT